MFPEGMSRYHSEMSPLKQGVSRIVSDTLTRRVEAGDSSFKLAIQTVSMSYPQRNSFRSDVLITFNPPIYVSAHTHPDLVSTPTSNAVPKDLNGDMAGSDEYSAHERAVRSLTSTIGSSIRGGILDAPSWSHLRAANTARRLYAPLGTKLTLGDHVRLTQRFVDALAGKRAEKKWDELEEQLQIDRNSNKVEGEDESVSEATPKLAERAIGTPAKLGQGLKEEAALKGREKTLPAASTPGTRSRKLANATEEIWKTPMREKAPDNANGSGGGYFAIATESADGRRGGDTATDGGFSVGGEEADDEVGQLLKDLKVSFSSKDRLPVNNPI